MWRCGGARPCGEDREGGVASAQVGCRSRQTLKAESPVLSLGQQGLPTL